MFFIVPHPSLSIHWLICLSLLCICFNIASIFVFLCFFAPCFSACGSSVALYQWLEADRQGRDPDITATGKAPSVLLHLTVWMLVSCLLPPPAVAVWFHVWYWFDTLLLIESNFFFFPFQKVVLHLTMCPKNIITLSWFGLSKVHLFYSILLYYHCTARSKPALHQSAPTQIWWCSTMQHYNKV